MLKPAGSKKTAGNKLAAVVMAATVSVVLSACATSESYNNDPKPPAVRTVSVIVGENEIAASPNPWGGGPTRFIVTNQTGVRQIVTFSSDRVEREVPVDVDQTANFKMTTEPGFFTIDASNTAANTLEVEVGPKRPSAQQDLNQP